MNISEVEQEVGDSSCVSLLLDKGTNVTYKAVAPQEATYPSNQKSLTLQDLPEEILEYILGFLSPYKEMDAAKLVSKQWNRVIKSLIKQIKRKFYHSLSKCDIRWTELTQESLKGYSEKGHIGVNDRFSHSAVYHDGSMYIFGGCTSTNTTFNDLWKFDLTTRQWIRPVAMGTYPSPKACATMVVYNGNLILFGGWSHPIPYPLHQSAHYFSELHVYNPVTNRWSHVLCLGQEPEALGGHSASVAGSLMVIFGGSPRPGLGTNNLWVFNFLKASWNLQSVYQNVKPEPRYGQFQTTLDEQHILIMGGCVGQNRVYNDLWLLTLHASDPWQWTKLTIEHSELAAPQTWCHAVCRVNNSVVIIARSSKVRQTRSIKKVNLPPLSKLQNCDQQKTGENIRSAPLLQQSERQQQHQLEQSHHHRQQGQQQKFEQQEQQHPQQHLQQRNIQVHQEINEEGARVVEEEQGSWKQRNLLPLQQRLHRDCMNLPNYENYHHSAQRADQEEAEGYFHRLNNKWEHRLEDSQRGAHCQPSGENSYPNQPEQQPKPEYLQHLSSNNLPHGRGHSMPSIRPNATSNRQRQLEALQRQEELLRSKSRAIAAAQAPVEPESPDSANVEENVPELITTRNNMDVHVLDISRVLSDGVAEWQPLSELQPMGAPLETICCSVLEGRGELLLFGGVIRNIGNPVITNTAVNKLYIARS